MRATLAAAALLLLLAAPARPAQYFFSATGDNTRTATQAQSSATPWQYPQGAYCAGTNPTCANAVTSTEPTWTNQVYVAGDILSFKAGDVFPMIWQITSANFPASPASAITINSYGAGAKPIIEGGQGINANQWASLGGNIYSTTFPTARLYNAGDKPQMYRSGIRWGKGGTIDDPSAAGKTCATLSAEGEMYYDQAGTRICVYTATNPTTDPDNTWLVGFRRWGIYQQVNKLSVSGLQLQHKSSVPSLFFGEYEIETSGSNTTLDSLTIFQSGGSGIRIFPGLGTILTGITISNNIISESWAYGMEFANGGSGSVGNWTITGNNSHHNGDHGISCNNIDTCLIANNTVDSNAIGAQLCGTSYCGPAAQDRGHNMTITGDCAANQPKHITIRNNLSTNAAPNYATPGNGGGNGIYVRAAAQLDVLGNVVDGAGGSGLMVQYDCTPPATPAVKIKGNTFVNTSAPELIFFSSCVSASANNWAAVQYNQIGRTSGSQVSSAVFFPGVTTTDGNCPSNTGYSSTQLWSANRVFYLGSTGFQYWCANSTQYQVAPCDTWTDTTGDPVFVNPAAHDLHLKSTAPISPSIDAGPATCPDTPTDIEGHARPQGAACDVGAFEVLQATTTSFTTTTSTSTTSTFPASCLTSTFSDGCEAATVAAELNPNGQQCSGGSNDGTICLTSAVCTGGGTCQPDTGRWTLRRPAVDSPPTVITLDTTLHHSGSKSCQFVAENNATKPPGQSNLTKKFLCGTRGQQLHISWWSYIPQSADPLGSWNVLALEQDEPFCYDGVHAGDWCTVSATGSPVTNGTCFAGLNIGAQCTAATQQTDCASAPGVTSCDTSNCFYDVSQCPGPHNCCQHFNPGRRFFFDANDAIKTDIPAYPGTDVTLSQVTPVQPPRNRWYQTILDTTVDTKANGGHVKWTQDGIVAIDADVNVIVDPINRYDRMRGPGIPDNQTPLTLTINIDDVQVSASAIVTTTSVSTSTVTTTSVTSSTLLVPVAGPFEGEGGPLKAWRGATASGGGGPLVGGTGPKR